MDDRDGLDPELCRAVRREILAGRALIAVQRTDFASTAWLARLVEDAATAAGRRGDLRIIDLDFPGPMRTQFLHPCARSIRTSGKETSRHPDLLRACIKLVYTGMEDDKIRLDHTPPGRGSWQAAQDMRATNAIPPFGPAEFAEGAPLVVLTGGNQMLPRAMAWLFDGALRHGALPMVASTGIVLESLCDVTGTEALGGTDDPGHGFRGVEWSLLAAGIHEAPWRSPEGPLQADMDWAAASAATDAGLAVTSTGGCIEIRSGGRVAVAAMASGGEEGAYVGLSDGGWRYPSVLRIETGRGSCDARDVEWVLRRVWRGGLDESALGRRDGEGHFAPAGTLGIFSTQDGVLRKLRRDEAQGWVTRGFSDALCEPWRRDLAEACCFAREPGRTYAWACVPGKEHRRRQYLKAMPAFAAAALTDEMSDAIDAGAEAVPVVSRVWGMDAAMVRRVARRPALPTSAHAWAVRDEVGMFTWGRGLLRLMGPDRVPAASEPPESWDAFMACVEKTWFGVHPTKLPYDVAAGMLARMRPPWSDRAGELGPRGDGSAFRTGEIIKAFGRLVSGVHTIVDRVTGIRVAARILCEGRSLKTVREISDRWHAHPVLSRCVGLLEPHERWFVPFDEVDLGDGWTATCLATVTDIEAEGARGPDASGMDGLAHCVATYAESCNEGTSVVVSLRLTEAGVTRRMSTLELVRGKDSDRWDCPSAPSVRQHYGLSNTAPPEGAVRALARLRALVEAGTVPMPVADAEAREIDRARILALGEKRLAQWQPFLPKRWRGLDLHAIYARIKEEALDVEPDAVRT